MRVEDGNWKKKNLKGKILKYFLLIKMNVSRDMHVYYESVQITSLRLPCVFEVVDIYIQVP